MGSLNEGLPLDPGVTRSSWLTGALLAGLFLALHLPFLPPSLEDLDSINFALGIRDFDVVAPSAPSARVSAVHPRGQERSTRSASRKFTRSAC